MSSSDFTCRDAEYVEKDFESKIFGRTRGTNGHFAKKFSFVILRSGNVNQWHMYHM